MFELSREPIWKMIYLARRNPRLQAEEFPQAWREHSALGRQCRNVGQRVKSVAQCARVLELAVPGTRSDYDGVNLLVLADRDSASAIWSDPETLAIMKPDEPRVFDRYVREFTLVCREDVLREAPRSGVVLHGFLAMATGVTEPFWRQDAVRAGLTQGLWSTAVRVVLNTVVDTPPPGYAFAATVEWWFPSLQDAESALRPAAGRSGLAAWAEGSALDGRLDAQASVFLLTQVTHQRP